MITTKKKGGRGQRTGRLLETWRHHTSTRTRLHGYSTKMLSGRCLWLGVWGNSVRVKRHLLVLGALSWDGIACGITSIGVHCVMRDHHGLTGGSKDSFRPVILLFSSVPLVLGKLLWDYAGRTDETVKAQRRLSTGNPGMGEIWRYPEIARTKKRQSWLGQSKGRGVLGTQPPQQTGTRSKTDSGAQIWAISRGRANAAEPFGNGGDTGLNEWSWDDNGNISSWLEFWLRDSEF